MNNPIIEKMLIVEWPDSQVCMECSHGFFMDMEDSSCHLCDWSIDQGIMAIPERCPLDNHNGNHISNKYEKGGVDNGNISGLR